MYDIYQIPKIDRQIIILDVKLVGLPSKSIIFTFGRYLLVK